MMRITERKSAISANSCAWWGMVADRETVTLQIRRRGGPLIYSSLDFGKGTPVNRLLHSQHRESVNG